MERNEHRDFIHEKIHEYHRIHGDLDSEKIRGYLAMKYDVLLYLDAMERRIDEYKKTDYYRQG